MEARLLLGALVIPLVTNAQFAERKGRHRRKAGRRSAVQRRKLGDGHGIDVSTVRAKCDGDFHSSKVVPKIRVKGKWLERAGFPSGSRVLVAEISPRDFSSGKPVCGSLNSGFPNRNTENSNRSPRYHGLINR